MGKSLTFVDLLRGGFRAAAPGEAKARRLFALRAFMAPAVAVEWANHLAQTHASVGAPSPPARVLAKPLRSYLKGGWKPRRRLQALLDHSRRASAFLLPDAARGLLAGDVFPLARLEARKSSVYRLDLSASFVQSTQREGEWVITLAKQGEDFLLTKLTFSLSGEAGGSLVIGGLQGPEFGRKRAVIDATRELHGLRPKDAALLAVRALARAMGGLTVLAVDDASHVLLRLQDEGKFSGYDAYWRERGAAEDPAFGFRFPPLEREAGTDGRARMKATIVDGVEAFVARAMIVAPSAKGAP